MTTSTNTKEALKRVLDERANAWETTGKPLADIAAEREFTAEERTKWEAAEADFQKYGERVSALTLTLEQEEAVRSFGDKLKDDTALRTAIEDEIRAVIIERSKPSFTVDFTGKELKRALAKGTASAGGNTVPTSFLADLITPLRDFSSVIAAGATIITTASGEEIQIPRLATPGAAVANIAENTAIGGTDPTFAQTSLKSYKHGQLVLAPRELVQDSAIDIEGLIVQLIAENIGVSLGAKLAIGAGTTETAGIATAATSGVTGAASVGGAPNFDNLIDLYYSVKAPYRTRGKFLIADQALGALRKLKGTDGQYIWAPSVQVGEPDLILGKPTYSEGNLEYGLGKKSIVFGDISKYWVRFVNSIEVARSDHAAFSNDQVAFRGILRADGLLTDAGAVKAFTGNAA